MTREEAITLIKSAQLMLINPTTNEPISDLHMALEMAIQALEQNESAEEWYKLFVKKLDEQKSGKWIPVSERLPEHYQIILFSTKTDRVFEGRYFKDETEHQWYSFRDECFAWNNVVTAWMPLPEPYKAESEE